MITSCSTEKSSSNLSAAGISQPESTVSSSEPKSITEESKSESQDSTEMTLGDTFEFDNLEITFETEIEWMTLDNEFADTDGAEVFAVPLTITNKSDETHGLNFLHYTVFGPSGTELDDITAYFDDDVIWEGDMRTGASQESYMHILYDGDGDYYIEFDDWTNKIDVNIPIKK